MVETAYIDEIVDKVAGATLRLPKEQWPSEYLQVISDFFDTLKKEPEVVVGYAGVMSDLRFSLDVVMMTHDNSLTNRVAGEMDDVGRRLGFRRHNSGLHSATLSEIPGYVTSFEKLGEFDFILRPHIVDFLRQNQVVGLL